MYSQKEVPTNFLFNMNPPRVSNYQSKLSTRCTHSTIVFLSLSPQKNLCVCAYRKEKSVYKLYIYRERAFHFEYFYSLSHNTVLDGENADDPSRMKRERSWRVQFVSERWTESENLSSWMVFMTTAANQDSAN